MDARAVKSLKGQAAVEMLANVGLVLLLLLPILLLLLVGAQVRFESLSQIQAASAARLIADSINEVYLEGPSAAKVSVINLPSNTKSITLTENEVVVTLEMRDGETQVTYPFFGVVSEQSREGIAEMRGLIPIKFTCEGNGKVRLEYGTQ